MSTPEHVELTTLGLSAALYGVQLMSPKTTEGRELLWQGDLRYRSALTLFRSDTLQYENPS
jgi:hypothetical protein